MVRHAIVITLLGICVGGTFGDTFRHRQTGEKFDGFLTQKNDQNKTLVYVDKDKAFKALDLGEYEITRNDLGRRNSIVVIPIRTEECLISQEVSKTIADTIVDASNKGPRYIVLEIDSPGGYGEYMKYVCATITNTTNCPVVSYISGGKYGGAYSAAAAVALATEKIYIAGDAAMGSVAPVLSSPVMTGGSDYYEQYSSDSLSGFRTYISAIASNRSRPVTLAMALLDKSIEIQEVEDQNGNRRYVSKDDRTPQETIVRTVSKVETRTVEDAGQGAGRREVSMTVVTVTADEAYKAKLADRVVGTREDVFQELGAVDAQVTYSRSIETAIRKFLATRRNLQQSLIQIDFLQQRVDDLKAQYDKMSEEVRTSPTTTERSYGDGYYGGESFRSRRYSDRSYGTGRYGDRNSPSRERQRVSGVAPPAGAYNLTQELGASVTTLVREYRRALGLAQRDPGALPPSVAVPLLQRRHDEAVARQNALFGRF